MISILVVVLTAICVTLVTWVALGLYGTSRVTIKEKLVSIPDGDVFDTALSDKLTTHLVKSYSDREAAPARVGYFLETLENWLMFAGYPMKVSVAVFLVYVLISIISTCIVFFWIFGVSVIVWMFATALSLMFWFFFLGQRIRKREREILNNFPYFLDLASMVVSSGGELIDAIRAYIEAASESTLVHEMRICVVDYESGLTDYQALHLLVRRVRDQQVRSCLLAIVQARINGTGIKELLQQQADSLRFMRSQLAERAAEELRVRLVPPVIIIVVAIVILIIGPLVIDVYEGGLPG